MKRTHCRFLGRISLRLALSGTLLLGCPWIVQKVTDCRFATPVTCLAASEDLRAELREAVQQDLDREGTATLEVRFATIQALFAKGAVAEGDAPQNRQELDALLRTLP